MIRPILVRPLLLTASPTLLAGGLTTGRHVPTSRYRARFSARRQPCGFPHTLRCAAPSAAAQGISYYRPQRTVLDSWATILPTSRRDEQAQVRQAGMAGPGFCRGVGGEIASGQRTVGSVYLLLSKG